MRTRSVLTAVLLLISAIVYAQDSYEISWDYRGQSFRDFVSRTESVYPVGEGSAGFNVRGGSADQNLILLYGAPLYNSSHFFGFFSAVNPDIIKDVTLYKGGIPSRYGGRLSSVMDIVSREGNRRVFAGSAGISPVTAHFTAEGPVKKDTLYYLVSGRTTFNNWVFGLMDNLSLRNSHASFDDLNASAYYDLNRKNKIDISAYYSFDSFRYNSDTTFTYRNNIASLRWRHFFPAAFFLFYLFITVFINTKYQA